MGAFVAYAGLELFGEAGPGCTYVPLPWLQPHCPDPQLLQVLQPPPLQPQGAPQEPQLQLATGQS